MAKYVKNKLLWIKSHTKFLRFLLNKQNNDELGVLTSSLSYTTIMSLVPLLAVLISVFSIFPGFDRLRQELILYIMSNFMPQIGDVLQDNINSFIEHATNTTIIGLFSLLIISLMLIRRIDLTLNKIWHTQKKRSRVTTFAVYWTVLTLGPILLGSSLVFWSSLTAIKVFDIGIPPELNTFAISLVPDILLFIIITIVFMAVPNTNVKFIDSVIGALLSTVAQSLVRRLFTLYIVEFSSYATVYGAVAALPVLMVWTHMNWYAVLWGAELAASMKLYRDNKMSLEIVKSNELDKKIDINYHDK